VPAAVEHAQARAGDRAGGMLAGRPEITRLEPVATVS